MASTAYRLRSISGVTLLAGALLTAAAAGRLDAVDFIRGDANGDGTVSIADARLTVANLFEGTPPLECLESADADDSNQLNITDPIYTLNYLAHPHAAEIPQPFPAVGADVTAPALGCASYGGGSPLADPAAKIEVLEASGSCPEGVVTITLLVSNSTPIAGYSVTILTPPGLLAGAQEDGPMDLTGTHNSGYNSAYWQDGELRVLFLSGFRRPVPIPPGADRPALQFNVYLAPGTQPGTYPLEMVAGELADHASGRAIPVALVSATLTVLPGTGECPGLPPDDLGDPEDVAAVFKVRGGEASPGSSVTLPFIIRADAEVQGYAFSLDFDEEVLQATDIEPVWRIPDGSDYGFAVYEFNNENATPGNAGVDEGFVVGAAVFGLRRYVAMPADTDNHAADLHFAVEPGAAGSTEIRFLDGGQVTGTLVPNRITVYGENVLPDQLGSFLFIDGVLHVLPDITIFIRGDSNGDSVLDLSDAQRTLNYLFVGLAPPLCLDAADVNDDGVLNIADPIVLLQHLFLGGSAPPPPFPVAGEDPTADALRCREGQP